MALTVLFILAVAAAPPDQAVQRLTQLRYAASSSPADVRATLEQGLAGLGEAETRGDQCLNEFYAGELYRLAAAADPRSDYAEQSLNRFRGMRVDYLDLQAGQLGYIGEARLLRQEGKPDESLLALTPLLDEKTDPRLRRLATLEAMEATLDTDPAAVVKQAESFGAGAEWLLARACARTERKDDALRLARLDVTASQAPPHDRLALIARLGALTDLERDAWAASLNAMGRSDEALAVLDGRSVPATSALHAMLLAKAGRHEAAAEQWRAVAHATGDPAAVFAMAQSLEASARHNVAITAYRQVFEGDASDDLRRGALLAWVNLVGPHGSLTVLESHHDAIGDDPYLRYALASAKFAHGLNEGLSQDVDGIARDADSDALRTAARLLQAEAQPDARAALQLLDSHRALLDADPAAAARVDALQARLWVRLGMIDSAADAMLAEPRRYPARAMLTAADALAARFEEFPDAALRGRVLRLCDAAIGRGDEGSDIVPLAAELLLRVGAFSDAQRILAEVEGSAARRLAARALRGMEKPQDALELIENDASSQASLIRGQCEMDLGRADRAVEAFRATRRSETEDSDAWWQATFGLCRAQAALHQREAALSILRVAETLHPLDDRPPLRKQLQTLQSELQP